MIGPQKQPSSIYRIMAQQKATIKELEDINKELNMVLNFVIFSKDRACQLDLLLRSLKNLSKQANFSVLYTYSESHELSYRLCSSEHQNVNWIKESNFCAQTKELIRGKTCLLTDDTVFFRDITLIPNVKESEIFSWRLGYNTYIQDHVTGRKQPYLVPDSMDSTVISWNPNNYPEWCNYGYPFSFDGHIYPQGMLSDILQNKTFKNTNEMEGILHSFRSYITSISSNLHSSCVNIPANNLSGLTASGVYHGYSLEKLKEIYIQGGRIYPIQKSKKAIIGCHQEMEFEFYGL
jgi:hypothetical protein